jgi:CIC family chloride channel protein
MLQLLWRGVDGLLLRRFLRGLPSEANRLFALTLVAGVLCGVAAVLFHLALKSAEEHLIERAFVSAWWLPLTVLLPGFGALGAGALLHWVPSAAGSGIPQVKVAYAAKSGRLRLRDSLAKFAICVLQIGTGSSLGREGPTVHICAGIASALGRLFALSGANARRLLPVGAAAGIAAAFNAPIAAVTFTIEELIGDLDQTVLSGVVVAAALAAMIERGILGEHPVFEISHAYGLKTPSSLLVYALLGVAAAALSRGFVHGLLAVRLWFKRLPIASWLKPGVGGLVTGTLAAGALAVFGPLGARGVTGGGYPALSEALLGNVPLLMLIGLCAMKGLATVFSYGSGGAGGIFAPTLFLGGMLGGTFGLLDQRLFGHLDSELGAFALVGMGAVFAGVLRAPITSVLIIFEMTRSYGLILPLMVANSISYLLCRREGRRPIYEALLEQDGIQLPHRSSAVAALSSLRVSHAMTSAQLATLSSTLTVAKAVEQAQRHPFPTQPVIGPDGRFQGLISVARLRRRLAEGATDETVGQQVTAQDHFVAEQSLVSAMVRMNELGVRQVAVVEDHASMKLLGILAMSDVMRAHARAASEALGHDLPERPPGVVGG